MYDLDMSDLKKFNPLYWKTEKGKILEDRGPTLYAKCLYSKREEKINTIFINEELNCNVNPLSILNKQCFVKFALRVESIFFGTKISLQVKLHEVLFRPKETILRSLLAPDAVVKNVEDYVNNDEEVEEEECEEEEDEEVVEEEEEDEEVVEEAGEITTGLPVEEVKPVPIESKKRSSGRKRKDTSVACT